jgi:ribose-phosphate pyrophosphokinase
VFLAPDAGALKKIYKLAELYPHCSVVCANKIRDLTNGKIIDTKINPEDLHEKIHEKVVWVVDDICDAGGTFLALAKAIPDYIIPKELNLYVTHGIFANNAKQRLKDAGYDNIVAYFDRTEDGFFKNLKD